MFKIFGLLSIIFFISCSGHELKTYDDTNAMIEDAKSQVEFVSLEDFKAVLESEDVFYLIDCREETEFAISCIQDAINIPRGLIEFKIGNDAPKRRTTVYLYCDNGDRSTLAATVLPLLKYSNVIVIESGFIGWEEKYPDLVELEPVRGGVKTDAPAAPSGGCGG